MGVDGTLSSEEASRYATLDGEQLVKRFWSVSLTAFCFFAADNLRLRRADPNALPAITERRRPPELHIHLHQLRRVVRRALEELPEEHHVPRGQRGGIFVRAKQAQRSARRLQGTPKI